MLTKEIIAEYAEKSGARGVTDGLKDGYFFQHEALTKFCLAISGFVVGDVSHRLKTNGPNVIDLSLGGPGVNVVGSALIGIFKMSKAPNYLEMRFADGDDGAEYAVLIQRAAGETPAQQKAKAVAMIRQLRGALLDLMRAVEPIDGDFATVDAKHQAAEAMALSERYSRGG